MMRSSPAGLRAMVSIVCSFTVVACGTDVRRPRAPTTTVAPTPAATAPVPTSPSTSDLRHATAGDADSLWVFTDAAERAQRRGASMSLDGPPSVVQQALELRGLDAFVGLMGHAPLVPGRDGSGPAVEAV
jgi:hypothetical protein